MLVLSHNGVLRAGNSGLLAVVARNVTSAAWHDQVGGAIAWTERVGNQTILRANDRTGRVARLEGNVQLRGWGGWGFILGDDAGPAAARPHRGTGMDPRGCRGPRRRSRRAADARCRAGRDRLRRHDALHRGRVVLGARPCHTGMVVTRQSSYCPTPGTSRETVASRSLGDASREAVVDPGGSQSLGRLVVGCLAAGGWRARTRGAGSECRHRLDRRLDLGRDVIVVGLRPDGRTTASSTSRANLPAPCCKPSCGDSSKG